jgi:hypothetical protein
MDRPGEERVGPRVDGRAEPGKLRRANQSVAGKLTSSL